ncbi:hypothetical protein P8452_03700 [Trifolium repens]|nr:hypothetical protein P8452_03700 [Trifolium repens]
MEKNNNMWIKKNDAKRIVVKCDDVVEADKKFLAMVYKIASRRPTKYFTKNICIHLRPAEGTGACNSRNQ